MCKCSELDWHGVDQTAEHHPDCLTMQASVTPIPELPQRSHPHGDVWKFDGIMFKGEAGRPCNYDRYSDGVLYKSLFTADEIIQAIVGELKRNTPMAARLRELLKG